MRTILLETHPRREHIFRKIYAPYGCGVSERSTNHWMSFSMVRSPKRGLFFFLIFQKSLSMDKIAQSITQETSKDIDHIELAQIMDDAIYQLAIFAIKDRESIETDIDRQIYFLRKIRDGLREVND